MDLAVSSVFSGEGIWFQNHTIVNAIKVLAMQACSIHYAIKVLASLVPSFHARSGMLFGLRQKNNNHLWGSVYGNYLPPIEPGQHATWYKHHKLFVLST